MKTYFLLFALFYIFAIFGFAAGGNAKQCETYRSSLRVISHTKGHHGRVCCENMECFSNEDGTQFEHWPEHPQCLEDFQPEFHVFTKEESNNAQIITDVFDGNKTLSKLRMLRNRQLFVIIHGWNTQWTPTNWMFPMKDGLIDLGHNVVIVRWSEGSNNVSYFQGGANALSVGTAVAVLIRNLVSNEKADLKTTTIIGFSLGAHGAGFAGKNLTDLPRLIALDPAGPMFACENPQARLAESDAKFVQVIHTNGDPVQAFGRGTMEQLGHVDFYANGGLYQPGCEEGITKAYEQISQLKFNSVWSNTGCSHARAPLLLTEMLKNEKMISDGHRQLCSFLSFPCDSSEEWQNGNCFNCASSSTNGCAIPGLSLNSSFKGQYYFDTQSNNATQYCGRQFRLTLTSNVEVKGDIVIILRNNGAESEKLAFQTTGSTTRLSKDAKSMIIVAPWDMHTVNSLLITYTPYKNIFFKDGVSEFTLTNATIEDTESKMYSSFAAVVNVKKKRYVNLFQKYRIQYTHKDKTRRAEVDRVR